MKLNKPEKAALILAAVFVALVVGYHFGVDSSGGDFTVSTENKYVRIGEGEYTASESGVPAESAAPPQSDGAAGGRININTAEASELCLLPGIGETLANRIITYRDEHGPFKSLDDIMNVSGIGEAKFSAVSDMITLAD